MVTLAPGWRDAAAQRIDGQTVRITGDDIRKVIYA
jgi:hypothetical protein